MAYIGNVPAEKYIALTQQTFSSPTGTSFTLSQAVTNPVDIDLYIDNVKQDPASYSVSGTALTTSTIASPSTMYCIFNGKAMQTVNPPDGSVGTAKVADDAITLAKLAPGTDGNIISFDASGNPVAVATGSSGQVLTSGGAGAPPTFATASSVSEASQAEQEAASATDKFVSPAKQHFHDSAPKAWLNFNGSGTIAIRDSYNITSIEDNGVSDYTINIATNMSSANYAAVGSCSGLDGAGDATFLNTNRVASSGGVADQSAGAIRIGCTDQAGVTIDSKYVSVAFFGDI